MMNITTILADSYHFFIGNLRQMAGLFLPILLIDTALVHMLILPMDAVSLILAGLVSIFIYPLYTGALIQLLARRTQHETPTNGQLLRAAFILWRPLLILAIITAIAVIFGFMLFIIPGIWIAVRLSFAEIYLVVEGLDPLAAIRKSHDTTKELFWTILFVVIISYALLIALDYLLEYVLLFTLSHLFGWTADASGGSHALGILGSSVFAFLGLFVNVAIFRIYLLHAQGSAQA